MGIQREILPKGGVDMAEGREASHTLVRADEIINGERQDSYGNPEDSFALIAEFWSVYLIYRSNDVKNNPLVLNASDIAIMMSLFKHARMMGQKWHPDNAVDACGYLAILNDRLKKEV